MKTNTKVRLKGLLLSTKVLARVTILGFLLGMASSHANLADAALAPLVAINLNSHQALLTLNRTYRKLIETSCATDSLCVAMKLKNAFRVAGFNTKTVVLTSSRRLQNFKMIPPPSSPYDSSEVYRTRVVTLVRLAGGWRVADPILLSSTVLERFNRWTRRVDGRVEMSVR